MFRFVQTQLHRRADERTTRARITAVEICLYVKLLGLIVPERCSAVCTRETFARYKNNNTNNNDNSNDDGDGDNNNFVPFARAGFSVSAKTDEKPRYRAADDETGAYQNGLKTNGFPSSTSTCVTKYSSPIYCSRLFVRLK